MALELQQETKFLLLDSFICLWLFASFLPKQIAPRAWLCYLFLMRLSRVPQLHYYKQVAPRDLLRYLFPAALSESLRNLIQHTLGLAMTSIRRKRQELSGHGLHRSFLIRVPCYLFLSSNSPSPLNSSRRAFLLGFLLL